MSLNEPEKPRKKFLDVFSTGSTDDEKKDRFQAGAIISMAAFLLGGLFQVAWMMSVSRMLGDRDAGLHMPMVSLCFLVANLVALGIPQTICTFVSHHYESDFEEARKFLTDGIRLLTIISLCVLSITTTTSVVLGLLGVVSWIKAALTIVLVFAVSMMILFWGTNSILNGFQRLELTALGNMIFPVGVFAGAVVFIKVGQALAGEESQWDVVGALSGQFFGHVIALSVAITVLVKHGRIDVRELFSIRKSYGMYRKILRFGGVAAIAMVSLAVLQQITPVVVRWVGMPGLLFGDTKEACESAIGHFSTALFYGMATMLLAGIAIAVLPAISEAQGQNRKDLMQHYFSSSLNQAFVIIFAFVMIYIVYIGRIIELISGPQFPADKMHNLGVQSVIGGGGAAMLFVIVHLFIGLKRPVLPAITLGAVLVFLTAGTVGLCFYFRDIHWAYAAFIVSTWGGTIVLLVTAYRVFGLRTELWVFLEPLAAGIPGLLFVYYVMPVESESPYIAAANFIILLVPFGLALWRFDRRRSKPPIPDETAKA